MARIDREDFLNSRLRHTGSVPAQFVETRIVVQGQEDDVHSQQLDRFVSIDEATRQDQISKDMWEEANGEMEQLFVMMEKARVKMNRKSNSEDSGLNLRQCKWEEVMQEVETTSRRWETSAKASSKTMLYVDKIGQSSDAFRDWLQLLPMGDYGSSICGVFRLAIGAAGQYSKVEEVIFKTLSEIPESMQYAQRYIQIYSDMRESSLERMTFELFRSVLRTLTHIMKFFADSAIRKFFEPLAKQSMYKRDLFQSIEDIKRNVARIKAEANQCSQWRSYKQGKLLQENQNLLQTIYEMLRANPALTSSASDLNQTLIQDHTSATLVEPASILAAFTSKSQSNMSTKAMKDILDILQYDAALLARDVETTRQAGDHLDEGPKAKTAALIRHDRFKQFIQEHQSSSSLLVNGHDDLASAEGLSPLSHVAVELVRTSEASGSVFVVKYFCNQHPLFTEDSPLSPPVTMMASLLGQLLEQLVRKEVETDLTFLSSSDWGNIKKMKLSTLCIVFRELTRQLPPKGILLCVIDEPTLYETAAFADNTEAVMRRLARLVDRQDTVIFKLLVTCRGRALGISQYFQENTLDLDESIEPQDSSNWTISTMQL